MEWELSCVQRSVKNAHHIQGFFIRITLYTLVTINLTGILQCFDVHINTKPLGV